LGGRERILSRLDPLLVLGLSRRLCLLRVREPGLGRGNCGLIACHRALQAREGGVCIAEIRLGLGQIRLLVVQLRGVLVVAVLESGAVF